MTSKQLNTLQAGRAFAALSVVFFHANDILRLPKYLGYDVEPFFRGGSSGVAFFFVLSGFVILLAHRKDLGNPGKVWSFVKKRFKRVYLPLWCILTLVAPVYFAVHTFGKGGERKPLNIILAYLVAPAPYERVLTPEWTLRHEILFYVFFALIIGSRRIGLFLLCLWLLLSAALPWTHPDFPLGFFFAANHLAFAFGMLACILYDRFVLTGSMARLLAFAGAAFFALAWASRCWKPEHWPHVIDLLFALGTATLILGLVNLERMGAIKIAAVAVFFGEASYSIYLVHHPALSLFTKVLVNLKQRPPAPVIFLAIVVLSVACGIVFHLLVEQPLLAFVNRKKFATAQTPTA